VRSPRADTSTLYGPEQSRFARHLERREQQRPDPVARELRRRLLAGLRGRVLEAGSGDGRSFEHYPPGVEQLLAVEPDPTARTVAADRARPATVPIEIVDGDAAELPAPDGAFRSRRRLGPALQRPGSGRRAAGAAACPKGRRRASVLGARSLRARRIPPAAALPGSPLLDALAGRVRDDSRHRGGDRRLGLRDRGARARLPLLVVADDHDRAVHPRHGTMLRDQARGGPVQRVTSKPNFCTSPADSACSSASSAE
jgi:Methyltransferase domain